MTSKNKTTTIRTYEVELNDILSFLKDLGIEAVYDEDCNTIAIFENISDDVLRQLEASSIVHNTCREYEYTYDESDFDYDCFSHINIYLLANDDED